MDSDDSDGDYEGQRIPIDSPPVSSGNVVPFQDPIPAANVTAASPDPSVYADLFRDVYGMYEGAPCEGFENVTVPEHVPVSDYDALENLMNEILATKPVATCLTQDQFLAEAQANAEELELTQQETEKDDKAELARIRGQCIKMPMTKCSRCNRDRDDPLSMFVNQCDCGTETHICSTCMGDYGRKFKQSGSMPSCTCKKCKKILRPTEFDLVGLMDVASEHEVHLLACHLWKNSVEGRSPVKWFHRHYYLHGEPRFSGVSLKMLDGMHAHLCLQALLAYLKIPGRSSRITMAVDDDEHAHWAKANVHLGRYIGRPWLLSDFVLKQYDGKIRLPNIPINHEPIDDKVNYPVDERKYGKNVNTSKPSEKPKIIRIPEVPETLPLLHRSPAHRRKVQLQELAKEPVSIPQFGPDDSSFVPTQTVPPRAPGPHRPPPARPQENESFVMDEKFKRPRRQ